MYASGLAAAALGLFMLLGASAPALAKHSARHASEISRISPTLSMYSRRALRRVKTILQLKLLELREERLDRARRVIENQLRLGGSAPADGERANPWPPNFPPRRSKTV